MPRHIKPQAARDLAYAWHGGQWSPLYAFASSGLVADQNELLREIRQCEPLAKYKTDLLQLRSLYRFARDCLARTPDSRYPFAAPWAL